MKKCPFCNKELTDTAIRCLYCRRVLSTYKGEIPIRVNANVTATDSIRGAKQPSHKRPLGITIISILYAFSMAINISKDLRHVPMHLHVTILYLFGFIGAIGLFLLKPWGRLLVIICIGLNTVLILEVMILLLKQFPEEFAKVVILGTAVLFNTAILRYLLYSPCIKEVFKIKVIADNK